jgi:hypothetical protein
MRYLLLLLFKMYLPLAFSSGLAAPRHTFAIGLNDFLLDAQPFVIRYGEVHGPRLTSTWATSAPPRLRFGAPLSPRSLKPLDPRSNWDATSLGGEVAVRGGRITVPQYSLTTLVFARPAAMSSRP